MLSRDVRRTGARRVCPMAALAASPWALAQDRTVLAQADKPPADRVRRPPATQLFGLTPPPGAPAAEEKTAKLVQRLLRLRPGVYTDPDPTHWSRAVNRLQPSMARGDLGSRRQVEARRTASNVDPGVHGGRLLPAGRQAEPARQRRSGARTYIDVSRGRPGTSASARRTSSGARSWGSSSLTSCRRQGPARVPAAERSTSSASRSGPRAPSTSTGDSHVELVWIPFQTFDDIGKPGADFYPVRLPSPTLPDRRASAFLNPDNAGADAVATPHYGVRANTLLDGWDLAAFYYRSFDVSPTFYRLPGPSAAQPFASSRSTTASGRSEARRARISDRSSAARSWSTRTAGTSSSTDPTAPQGVLGAQHL